MSRRGVKERSLATLQEIEESKDAYARHRVGLPIHRKEEEEGASSEEKPRKRLALTQEEFLAKYGASRNTLGDNRPDDELPDNFEGRMRRRVRRLLRSLGALNEEAVPVTRKKPQQQPPPTPAEDSNTVA